MEGERNQRKRQRDEYGQGEAGPQEKKLHSQNNNENLGSLGMHGSSSMSGSSLSAHSSITEGSSNSRGDQEDVMVSGDSPQDVIHREDKSTRKYTCNPKVKRGESTAQYEIEIPFTAGKWSTIKDYAKQAVLKYVNAAGNSCGGKVTVDLGAVDFGIKKSMNSLINSWYNDIEKNFYSWDTNEKPSKLPLYEKRFSLTVPPFKFIRSVTTNIRSPGYERNDMLDDRRCRELLEKNKDNYPESQIAAESSFQYDRIINSGNESPMLQFKLLDPENKTKLSESILKKSNGLKKYVSAFACHKGGQIMYGVEDGTGKVKGQTLSSDETDAHYFKNVQQKILTYIGDRTLWLCSNDLKKTKPDSFLNIYSVPVENSPQSRTLVNEFQAVVVVNITPFDGVVFESSKGLEAYVIDDEKLEVVRLTTEEWLKEKRQRIDAKTITDEMSRLKLDYESVSDHANLFEAHNTTSEIRKELFRISKQFNKVPEGFVSHRNDTRIDTIQTCFIDTKDEGIILADIVTDPTAVFLFIISRSHGLHIYMLPEKREIVTSTLKDHLERSSILLKKQLYKRGGCRMNLEIQIHLILDDDLNKEQLMSDVKSQSPFSESEVNQILDSYIRVVGSFPNHILTEKIGLAVLNVLTEQQFEVFIQVYTLACREMWIHGLPGTGKTALAMKVMEFIVKHKKGPLLFVAENQGLVELVSRGVGDVKCMTREKFVLSSIENFQDIKSIVMDEVHHYRVDSGKPNWYQRATEIVSGKDEWENGYLWLFLDMFQKDNSTFDSGIPDLPNQTPKVSLTKIVRCSRSIWDVVKPRLEKSTLTAPGCGDYYRYLLSESDCQRNVVGQDPEFHKSKRAHMDSSALYSQVTDIVKSMLLEHWKASDIGILFPKQADAEAFTQHYSMSAEQSCVVQLKPCTEPGNHAVCDSVRRFSGMEKPCIILVEPSVKEKYFSANAFEALGMSRAMVKLVVIEK